GAHDSRRDLVGRLGALLDCRHRLVEQLPSVVLDPDDLAEAAVDDLAHPLREPRVTAPRQLSGFRQPGAVLVDGVDQLLDALPLSPGAWPGGAPSRAAGRPSPAPPAPCPPRPSGSRRAPPLAAPCGPAHHRSASLDSGLLGGTLQPVCRLGDAWLRVASAS